MKKETSLALFDFAGLTVGSEQQAVYTKVVKDLIDTKTGQIYGSQTTYKLAKISEAKKALGLEGKDNREEFERVSTAAQVLQFRRLKAELNNMDETQLALKRFSAKRGKDGLLDMSLRIKEAPARQSDLTIEEVAEVYGETVEQARKRFEKAGLRPSQKPVSVESEVVPPKEISAGIEEAAKEAAATEKAAMEAERAAQLDAQNEASRDSNKGGKRPTK